ncbi:TetR/AcrR family transcriptional regulator [Amycolatopsis rubida]|uniref:TetR/AcrR family transcriptional regulator n=1 Tax=Amycolatopsis rubida TaxID=112413 RepID=A0A1I5R1Q0_9PSEU|nr:MULTISPECIES: TetR/AcrR family transcriptional regulator [Amycolatopsis]MYW95794.1 TetR family transcriptional regulator [Amycolatopsis rubida]NEC60784.1 TetR/AcrR family transcriptional regulator [Amycolatopsis rubida]OAP26748.1 Bacterial regulatory protein, tetR family [Amycolatopsis sp. M39]SFP52448.1 transcriptional regulator, TetR family [Amycolatopsis rubida]
MARASTRARVHAAVLSLAAESGFGGLTMEGIAARAGAGKQTLYRTWSSPAAVLLDALLGQSLDASGEVAIPDTGDLRADLETLVHGMIAELTDPATDRLLRAVTAELQTDPAIGAEVLDRLLGPQLRAIADRLARAEAACPEDGAELLLGPVFHRWLLRTRPFPEDWPAAHVDRVLRAVSSGG